jgi:hypothetical protein
MILSYLGALRSKLSVEKISLSPLESINSILNQGGQKKNEVFLTNLGKAIAKFPIKLV